MENNLLLYKSTIENAPIGVYICEYVPPDGLILLYQNKETVKLAGFDYSDYIGQEMNDILPDFEASGLRKSYLQVMKTGKTFETENVRYNDENVEGAFKIRAFKIEEDKLVISFDNITEQVKILQDLKRSQERFTCVIKNLDAVVFIINSDGILELSEGKALEKIGLEPGEAVGLSAYDLYKDVPGVVDSIKKALGGVEVQNYGTFNDIMFSVHYSPILVDGDGAVKIAGVATDITERLAIEDKLRQSQKMEALGQLAGGIAHDFNNQLGAIKGYTELLMETDFEKDEATTARYLNAIDRATNNSANLVRELLSFARKGKNLSVPVDMHKIVTDVYNILGHTFNKKINVKTYLNAENSIILGDPTQLQSAILNICINADAAMPSGGDLTLITDNCIPGSGKNCSICKKYEQDGHLKDRECFNVNIIDSGVGMNENTKSHIFEPFFTTKGVGFGTGMGLAAVDGTVESHGGNIFVNSELGSGSNFVLCFPVSEKREMKYEKKEIVEINKNLSVLVIDDEIAMGKTICELAKTLGHKPIHKSDAINAVDYYCENYKKIDLVILDIVMPNLNGEEVFNRLKRINIEVKVLLSSGFSFDDNTQQILDSGASEYVQKPYSKAELSIKIANIFPEYKK